MNYFLSIDSSADRTCLGSSHQV